MRDRLPSAMLLDLDDTIIDDTGSADRCWELVCAEMAPVLGVPSERLVASILSVRDWFWSDVARHRDGRMDLRAATRGIVELALGNLDIVAPEEARFIAETYRDRRDACQELLPGAIDVLDSLQKQGIRMALLTNGAEGPQQKKIERFGLASYFDCVVIEGAFGVGKPDPRVYQHALAALGAEPTAAWMVGDNLEWDVAAPQRLGLQGIWIDVKQKGVPDSSPVRPDRVIAALRELM
jgi:putative hydrolase of the HAD superfamily